MNSSPVPYPTTAVVEFTAACNLRCVFCPVGRGVIPREGRTMTDAVFERIIDAIRPFATYVYIGGYGEQLLHPKFARWVSLLREFAKLNLATNLTVVTEQNMQALCMIDDLSVSISGGDPVTYGLMHGPNYFQTARRNLKRLRELRQGKVDITYIGTLLNRDVERARKVLGDFDVKPLALPMREAMRWLLPKDGASRFTTNGGQLELKADIGKCREMWNVVYFLADGTATFCCYDYAGEGKLGNIERQTFDEIWNGERYQRLRGNHMTANYHRVCREQCSMP